MKLTRIHLIYFTAIVLAVLSPGRVHAQSQPEMNQQANEEFVKADNALNKVYKQLLSKIDKQSREKLKAAQRAWIEFRDADADLAADLEARGGSMWPLICSTRRCELTEARTKELLRMLKEYGRE